MLGGGEDAHGDHGASSDWSWKEASSRTRCAAWGRMGRMAEAEGTVAWQLGGEQQGDGEALVSGGARRESEGGIRGSSRGVPPPCDCVCM